MPEQELREQSAEELIRELTWIVSRVNQGLHLNDGHLDFIQEAARRLALLPKDEWRTEDGIPGSPSSPPSGRPETLRPADFLPCPFCGGVDIDDEAVNAISCRDCGGGVRLDWNPGMDEEIVVAAWNRRLQPAPSPWRSIESDPPPKDGTRVLLWSPVWEMSWGVQVGRFEGDRWVTDEGEVRDDEEWPLYDDGEGDADEDDEDGPITLGPTVWMTLPAPPTLISQQEAERD